MEILEIIKKTFKKLVIRSILTSVVLIGVAILLITNPEKVLSIAVIISGIVLIINAIIHIIVYMGQGPQIRATSSEFIIGVGEGALGVLFFVKQDNVISVFYILVGVWLLLEAVQKLQMVINLKDYVSNWALTTIVAIIDLMLGILVIAHPYDAGTSITQITGIILAVSEGFNLIESIYTLFKVKRIGKENIEVAEQPIEKETTESKENNNQE